MSSVIFPLWLILKMNQEIGHHLEFQWKVNYLNVENSKFKKILKSYDGLPWNLDFCKKGFFKEKMVVLDNTFGSEKTVKLQLPLCLGNFSIKSQCCWEEWPCWENFIVMTQLWLRKIKVVPKVKRIQESEKVSENQYFFITRCIFK